TSEQTAEMCRPRGVRVGILKASRFRSILETSEMTANRREFALIYSINLRQRHCIRDIIPSHRDFPRRSGEETYRSTRRASTRFIGPIKIIFSIKPSPGKLPKIEAMQARSHHS